MSFSTPSIWLQMSGIVKEFPGVRALDGVDFELAAGEVHALMGENGAGKSTLMKVLGGVHQPTAGEMSLKGKPYQPRGPKDAQEQGVGFIHQELKLVPELEVAENIMLGRYPSRLGWVDFNGLRSQARAALEELGVNLPLEARVGGLNVGQQQMVEIAKALAAKSEILIMDEPTASLSQDEAERLFEVIRRLRQQGRSVVYISHRMEEVVELSDRVTVLRDGKTVGTLPRQEITEDTVVRLMVGRELEEQFPERHPQFGEVVLEVCGLTRRGAVEEVSFAIKGGEILGLAGLVGAGRTEIARLIIGADPLDSGEIKLSGRPVRITRPIDSIDRGIGYLSEDRKGEGLVLGMSIQENIGLANFGKISHRGWLDKKAALRLAESYVAEMKIRTPSVRQAAGNLSGGNQQKVAMAKWLARDCRVMILDEPTRGVDVGARAEIYRLVDDLSKKGVAILLISSDLPELMGLSDRILAIHHGRVAAEFERGAGAEAILAAALSGQALGGQG